MAVAVGRKVRQVVSCLREVVAEEPGSYGQPASSPELAHGLFVQVLGDRPTEEFWALLLDGRHRSKGLAQIGVGTLTSSLVHPREVFGPAVRQGAAALVLAHNHPSGDPEPSQEDLELTRRLIDCGKLLGIPLVDHLVIGDGSFVSLRSRIDFG